MAESLFTSLLHTLDKNSISGIARGLGESETSVARGMESSIGAVLGGLATQSEEPGMLRKMLDMVPSLSSGMSWARMAADVASAGSPLIAGGKRILSGLFGGSENAIASAIGHDSGLGSNAASTLMAMAGPMVMGLLSRKIREGDMTVNGLGAMLRGESSAVRNALPASVSDLIWRRTAVAEEAPVIAQTVQRETSSSAWPWALGLGALALGCLWLFSHGRQTSIGSVATGTASRLEEEAKNVGRAVIPDLHLKIPGVGGESRLLAFVRDTNATPDGTWYEFDRLRFDTGSARLRPESNDQIDDIAAIFMAYPNVHATIAGHTDSKGNPQANMALSEARADAVRNALTARGVSENRLTTEGYGEKKAIADNMTDTGRAENRRVSVQVTGK
jgi:outer membrane protein OmpA-like peptidoglycan-associated protein